jgi:hypothetical protein
MPRATKLRDKQHARIYAEWLHLPAWQTLTPFAKTLLTVMLTMYLPSAPVIKMPDRTAAAVIPCARATAAQALADLEERGWISVECVGARCKKGEPRRSSCYRLNNQPFYYEPPSMAFLEWKP